MNNKNQINNLDELLRSQRDAIFKDDDELYDSIDISEHKMTPSFERKMRKKIRRQISDGHRRVWTRLEKVAVFIIAIYTAAFVSALSVEAIREAVWDVIVEWLGISYSVTYDENEKDPTREITEKREPVYLPGEYEKEVAQDNPFIYYLIYSVDGEKVLTYEQASVQGTQLLDGDDCISSYVYVNGAKCFMAEYPDGRIALSWSDGTYFYVLSGYDPSIDSDEIIKIAESIG